MLDSVELYKGGLITLFLPRGRACSKCYLIIWLCGYDLCGRDAVLELLLVNSCRVILIENTNRLVDVTPS